MYQMAKTARDKLKAKARSLAGEKDRKVDSSDWTPAKPLNADIKTGARPIMKPSSKGVGESIAAADTKAAIGNPKRGAYKTGGAVKDAGVKDKKALGAIDPSPKRGATPKPYKKGGKIGKDDGGIVGKLNRMVGYKSPAQKMEEGLKDVGKGRTSSYSSSEKESLSDIAKGGSGSTLPSDETEFGKSQNYKKGGKAGGKWIQKAIEKPGALRKALKVKEGEKIPAKKLEAAAEKGGKLGKRARLAQTLGRMNRATGGATLMSALKGATKKTAKKGGKTDINIVINAGKPEMRQKAAGMPMPGGPDLGPAPMPPMAALPAPPAAMMPPPPPMAGAMPPGRKAGGRITKVASSYKDMEAGAATGEGRLQKTDIAKHHRDAPARKAGGRISKVAKSYKDMTAGAGDGEGRLQKTDIAKAKMGRGK